MKNYPIYQVDAFAKGVFSGNPAAVCPLSEWIADDLMQKIANENNLAETAFFVKKEDHFELRWFTPVMEVNLCGHATLASAHILFSELGYKEEEIRFMTKSGILKVQGIGPSEYLMDFPADHGKKVEDWTKFQNIISNKILDVYLGKDDYMIIVENETEVRNSKPNLKAIRELSSRGIIISAPGDQADFVSRCFFPQYGIDEDPATGSAHTLLTPYWAMRLRKNHLQALQLSQRVGYFTCIHKGERVALIGEAVTFMKGEMQISGV